MKLANNLPTTRVRADRQKGAVAVEMAIIVPIFALFLLGIMEVGMMAREHQILQNAAREGARFSALPANRIDGAENPGTVLLTIQSRVVAYLANENITVSVGDVEVDQEFPVNIGALTVNGSEITINYSRPLVFPGFANLVTLDVVELTGKAVFRNFY